MPSWGDGFTRAVEHLFLFKRRDIEFRHRVGQTALRLGNVTLSGGWPARPHSESAGPQRYYRAAPPTPLVIAWAYFRTRLVPAI
jgi:hypothetical protein